MRIETDVKLDFKDVLIRPKRSTLASRSEVSLQRTFVMRNAKDAAGNPKTLTCVPIIAANMDTTGTFEMAAGFLEHDCLVAIHKHYSVEEWVAFDKGASDALMAHITISMGSGQADFEKVKTIIEKVRVIRLNCICGLFCDGCVFFRCLRRK